MKTVWLAPLGALTAALCTGCAPGLSIGPTEPVGGVASSSASPLVLMIDSDVKGQSCLITNSGTNVVGRRFNRVEGARTECCPTGFKPAGLQQRSYKQHSLLCLEEAPAARAATTVHLTLDGKECLGVGYTPNICCPDGWAVVGRVKVNPETSLQENVICLSP